MPFLIDQPSRWLSTEKAPSSFEWRTRWQRMTDILDPAARSERMSRIRSRDTKPELNLRKALHRQGLRYRLGGASLPGRPDLVFPRYKSVVLVHGCFWHRHAGCKVASVPKSNVEFWMAKFSRNVERDLKVTRELHALGWKVIVAWECDLATKQRLPKAAETIAAEIRSGIGAHGIAV